MGKFSSLFCNTIHRQILHILMKHFENRIWVVYNIKVHYVQVTEPCSIYLPKKMEIRRSYMRSHRLYKTWKPWLVNPHPITQVVVASLLIKVNIWYLIYKILVKLPSWLHSQVSRDISYVALSYKSWRLHLHLFLIVLPYWVIYQ